MQETKNITETGLFEVEANTPEWIKDAVIYEVHLRQYTEEGTFNAFKEHLPRLKEMGVDIIWLMPIHPIGIENRKGELGSFYAISDYKTVNPEFGTLEDFTDLVNEIHSLGMKVILDYVANHTAFDNPLKKEHPDWYVQDSMGNPISEYDWTDVIKLNYENRDLWDYMIGVMKYWVTEFNIDGFRCDMAGLVRQDFWEAARDSLNQIKPVLMLAEDQDNYNFLNKAFDINYSWELHHLMNNIARQEAGAQDLKNSFVKEDSIYPSDAIRLRFITNHDENKNAGSEFERMGDAVDLFAVFTFTIPGIPLIFSGQEIGMEKRLKFTEKDFINWDFNNKYHRFYKQLIQLKKLNPPLWNGKFGGDFSILNYPDNEIFAFTRKKDNSEVIVILNMSPQLKEINIADYVKGNYSDYFNKKEFSSGDIIRLNSWGYTILTR